MAWRALHDLLTAHPRAALIIVFGALGCVLALVVKVESGSDVTLAMASAVAGGTWVYGTLLSLLACGLWGFLQRKKGTESSASRAVGLAALDGLVLFGAAVLVFLPGLVLAKAGLLADGRCGSLLALSRYHVLVVAVVGACYPAWEIGKQWSIRHLSTA